MSAPRNAMELPLEGVRAVEASAGTGKTFTIATLYLRLILERGLEVDQIVVATFTRAAAAELSDRLRARLVIADTLLHADAPEAGRDGDSGDQSETRKTVAQALAAGVALDELKERAREARLATDTAFIGTLHGFCHRALAEFGFDTGQALAPPELIDDIRALQDEIVRDFWRRGSGDATVARLLADTWCSPEQLARQVCDPRWRDRNVSLPEPDIAALSSAFDAALGNVAAWSAQDIAHFEREAQRCIKDTRARNSRVGALHELREWAQAARSHEAALSFDAKAAACLRVDNIAALKPEGIAPAGRIFDDVAALATACAALQTARSIESQLSASRLLREARAFLESELPRRLAERNLMGHDEAVDRLAAALADDERGRLAATRIRARWKAALIDEFQDTDTTQWNVVQALFGGSTLVLVGDPKQAIYGFRGGDVFAWLEARRHAEGEALRLALSRRAGAGLCRGINALFSPAGAFIEAGIGHPDLQPAETVAQAALLRDGKPLPALELWWLDPDTVGHASNRLPSKARAQHAIERACVGWIARMLRDESIRLLDKQGTLQELRPRHLAVLVNSNGEAHALQAALGRAGIPASCNLRASAYTSDEATDLAMLVDALAAPDDPARARAARASLLVGEDAAAIARGRGDDAVQARMLEDVAGWATSVRRQGPLPWLHALIGTAAPRLLATPQGERRIANYLQLAELLQEMHAASFGIEDLAARFARARVEAADDADSARLRLDTDADAVTISTVHAAKGLEYDVVLVPYAVLGRDPTRKRDDMPALHWYHEGNAAQVSIGAGTPDELTAHALREVLAEDVRKLYVAVTRGSALCVLPWGPVSSAECTAACHLLHVAGRDQPLPVDAAGCDRALQDLCVRADGHARIVRDLPGPAGAPRAPAVAGTGNLRALQFARTDLQRDWTIWSFSRLVRGSHNAAAETLPGAGDQDDDAADGAQLGGARFGSAVHQVFERTDFAAWRGAEGAPAEQRGLIARALADHGVNAPTSAMTQAVDAVGSMMRNALNATLPSGARLADIPSHARRAEIEFHLALAPAASARFFALLHAHGYQRHRSGIAAPQLAGLLTGKIDLTYRHARRYWIADWKTNRCPPYDAAALDAEIARHDYDLQWILYTLALHRWLGATLDGYDYERDFGGVEYLFVRGMRDGGGVRADRPPRALVDALDALFPLPRGVAA
ncbi:MAG TPA: UvrD-helicase domain-containing protein [Rhodanobacteraceae bacterium]|nr:UvrD-helicase domain-containing protein [Rhodanobacteraceae bacterium]